MATSNDVPEPSDVKIDGPLRILVADDLPLAEVLEREWRARSEHAIEITNSPISALQSRLNGGLQRLDTDVVIFPSNMLGQLVEQKLLRPTPSELISETAYQNADIFDLVRRRETQWNRQPYAVSFGSPTLVLLRRTDLVKDAPITWSELNDEVAGLSNSLPEGIVPIAQPFANEWAARMLLVRAAAYLYDSSTVSTVFEYATMEPRISSPPFQRAADEMASSLAVSRRDLTPESALREFLQGKAALAITWPNAWNSGPDRTPLEFPIAVSELPGSTEHRAGNQASGSQRDEEVVRVSAFGIDGRLGAVSRSAKNAGLANIFLAWASGPEQSGKLCPRSKHSAPFRHSHASSSVRWLHPQMREEHAKTYFDITRRALETSAAIQCPRLPGHDRYMSALSDAVQAIVAGGKEVDEALNNAANTWRLITEDLGLEGQKLSYRRSLGIDTN